MRFFLNGVINILVHYGILYLLNLLRLTLSLIPYERPVIHSRLDGVID